MRTTARTAKQDSDVPPPAELPGLTPEVYARWRASEIGATTERLERKLILERIGDVRGKTVLEIGCGDGTLAVLLAEQGAKVSAIDMSEAMIQAARRRAQERNVDVNFQVAAAERIPFEAEKFDIVVAMSILCFIKNASPVFQEIARVLRPGGRLVIGELGKWSTWALQRRLRAWLGSQLWKRAVFRTPQGLRRLAEAAGLQPLEVRGAIYYPRWTWAARCLAPLDHRLSLVTNFGAAFLALEARKPPAQQ